MRLGAFASAVLSVCLLLPPLSSSAEEITVGLHKPSERFFVRKDRGDAIHISPTDLRYIFAYVDPELQVVAKTYLGALRQKGESTSGTPVPSLLIYSKPNFIVDGRIDFGDFKIDGGHVDEKAFIASTSIVRGCAFTVSYGPHSNSFATGYAVMLINKGISLPSFEKCMSAVGARIYGFYLDKDYHSFAQSTLLLHDLIEQKNTCNKTSSPTECLDGYLDKLTGVH